MLKQLGKWNSNSLLIPLQYYSNTFSSAYINSPSIIICAPVKLRQASGTTAFHARRRVIYNDDDDDEDDANYGYNEEIAVLESYTQLMKDEILLVEALVDEEIVEVLIFKGFSSCLSSKTYSDPSRSVVPTKAVIKSIDRAKGPFDPSHVQFIERGLTFDAFRTRFNL